MANKISEFAEVLQKITYSIIADYPARFPVQEQTLEGGNGNMKRRNLKAEERHAAKAKVAMNIQAGWSEPLLPDHYLSQHCTS